MTRAGRTTRTSTPAETHENNTVGLGPLGGADTLSLLVGIAGGLGRRTYRQAVDPILPVPA